MENETKLIDPVDNQETAPDYKLTSLSDFAKLILSILKSDRDVTVAVGGFTGEGKSTFSTLLGKEYLQIQEKEFSFNCMTWSRQEFLDWINGTDKSDVDPVTNLKDKQLPEYSLIVSDELFRMFYKRTWYEGDQIDAISTLNTCRDRHLLIIGNVPNFWDLDSGFRNRVRYYVYIYKRGVAWVFQQENNPFNEDKWNMKQSCKTFRHNRGPYKLPNFVCQIKFPDWDDQEKEEYYKIRNEKRLQMLDEGKTVIDKQHRVRKQRDELIRYVKNLGYVDFETISKITGIGVTGVREIIKKTPFPV